MDVSLPLLDSAAGIDLDVQERTLSLRKESAPQHSLDINLPYAVDEEHGSAQFDKSKKCLSVTLPIKVAPVMKTERLSSNDSGIGLEEGYRTRGSVESMEESDETPESDEPKEGLGNPALAEEFRTKANDYLDASKTYIFPNFTNSVQDNVIIYTLEVKNVSPESIEYKVLPDKLAVHLKFSSVGSGLFPIFHAFFVEFPGTERFPEDGVEVERWDNNLVLQLPFSRGMRTFRVGSCPAELKEKEYKVEKFGRTELSLQDEVTGLNFVVVFIKL